MNSNIVEPLEKAFLEVYHSKTVKDSNVARQLWDNITNMIFKFVNVKNDEWQDIAQQTYLELLESFKANNSFWIEAFVHKKKNDEQIISYVYGIIRTALRLTNEEFKLKPKRVLFNKINKIINELIEEKFITKEGKKVIYKTNPDVECEYDSNYENINEFQNVLNKADSSINYKKLKEFIVTIFKNYLENCLIAISHLKTMISYFTNIDNMTTIGDSATNEEDKNVSILSKLSSNEINDKTKIELEDLAEIKVENAFNNLSEKDFEIYGKMFLLRYYSGKTLRELSMLYNMPKSTIDRYVRLFIDAAELKDELIKEGETTNVFINIFYQKLINRFRLEVE